MRGIMAFLGMLLGSGLAGIGSGFGWVFRLVWLGIVPPLVVWPLLLAFTYVGIKVVGNWWFFGLSWTLVAYVGCFGLYCLMGFALARVLVRWLPYAPGYGVLRNRLGRPVRFALTPGRPLLMVRWWPGASGVAVPSLAILVAVQAGILSAAACGVIWFAGGQVVVPTLAGFRVAVGLG